MNEVKGGIVIKQMKKYAEELSDSTEASASAGITVFCNRHSGEKNFDVYLSGWSSKGRCIIKPRFKTEDLRDLGQAIDDYINGSSKTGKENEK